MIASPQKKCGSEILSEQIFSPQSFKNENMLFLPFYACMCHNLFCKLSWGEGSDNLCNTFCAANKRECKNKAGLSSAQLLELFPAPNRRIGGFEELNYFGPKEGITSNLRRELTKDCDSMYYHYIRACDGG